jgi:hypothetical protein
MLPPTSYLSLMQLEMIRLLPTRSKREKDAFAALKVKEQAWRFMNWLGRRVHAHPRQVNLAQDFHRSPSVLSNQSAVEALLAKIESGTDLTPHLSEDIQDGYCLHPNGRKHGRDFDLLLNEWAIHHLHLSTEPGRRGFNKRTKDLLYAIFCPGVAFVLAVAPHDAWTNRLLIDVTVRSWPDQRLFIPLNVLPGRDWTEDDHKGLRKSGLTVASVVHGRSWISSISCGITSALISTRTSKETGRILRCLHQASQNPEHLERQLRSNAAANGLAWPLRPVIHVRCFNALDRYCFCFLEESSGAVLMI